MGHDGSVVASSTGNLATITGARLNIADKGTLRHSREREDVPDYKFSLLASVDELPRVHTLSGADELVVPLVFVCVLELHFSDGGASSRVMDNLECESPTFQRHKKN